MYIYIILAVLGLIIYSCLKSRMQKANLILLSVCAFVILSSATTSVVNSVRLKYLKTKFVVTTYNLESINYSTDTIYIMRDTVKEKGNIVISEQKYNIFPGKNKFNNIELSQNYCKLWWSKENNTLMFKPDGKLVNVQTSTPIMIGKSNSLMVYNEYYVGDKWTEGWILPKKNTYYVVSITPIELKKILLLNPKLRERWNII